MSSPVDFLQSILSEVGESARSFARKRDPEYLRRMAVLRKLDELKIKGEELGIKGQESAQTATRLAEMQQRAGLLARGDSGRELEGPPSPDPAGAAREQALMSTPQVDSSKLGAQPGEEDLATSVAGASSMAERERRVEAALGQRLKGAQATEMESRPGLAEERTRAMLEAAGLRMENTKLGREAQDARAGMFFPITDQQGRITAFYNPKTGVMRQSPVPGGRRAGLPAAENSRRGMLASTINDAKELGRLAELNPQAIGVVAGRLTNLKRSLVGVPEDVSNLFRISKNISDMLLRARSGAQINEQEYQRLSALIPDPQTPLPTFRANLKRYIIEAQNLWNVSTGDEPIPELPEQLGAAAAPSSDGLTPEEDAILRKHGLRK